MAIDTEHDRLAYRRGCRCDECLPRLAEYERRKAARQRVSTTDVLAGERCTVNDCSLRIYSTRSGESLCRRHHVAWLRFGTVESSRELMFDELVDRSNPAGCHLWIGGKYNSGYGAFQSRCAHRWAYEFANGPIPEGMDVDHRCHVKACVNPAHLRAVTRKQNLEHRQPSGHGKSGIRGVDYINGRWRARVRHNGLDFNVGQYGTAEEAAEAARLKRLELFTHSDLDRREA